VGSLVSLALESGRKRLLLVKSGFLATLSNCGKFLKLQIPSSDGKPLDGRGNDLGYGKNSEDKWIIRSQVLTEGK
jgi:hypothetical protein